MNDNPATILAFDPAAVAIRASSDEATLEQLVKFADQLTRYVNLVQQQHHKQHQQQVAAGNADSVATTSHLRSSNNRVQNGGSEVGEGHLPVAVKSEVVAGVHQLDNEHSQEEQDHMEVDSSMTMNESPRKRARLSMDRRQENKSLAASRSQQPQQQQQQQQIQQRAPRCLKIGYDGDLESSNIRRSIGQTRTVLNKHLTKLGLTAYFANGVVSKHGHHVSHLTFSNKWNDLPFDTSETFEWWLGVGPSRLDLASPLDPNQYQQPKDGIPVFWARKQNRAGGSLCHYIGHFRCIRFEKCKVNFKNQPRQALIEFKFEHFDEALSQTMASI